ncbi:MATE family efflux transporter [Amylibacter sp.]|nr:MATE family efflux transporter [Amylibacter sp.]
MNKIISSEITHKRVLFLAFPVVLSNATIPILGAVDTAVVGQMGLATPIGAVGIAAVILTAIFWLFGFLRMGISGLTAQALGEGNNIEANALLIRSLTIGFAIGLFFIVVQVPLFFGALWLSPASMEVKSLAKEYLDIRIYSGPAVIGLYGITGWLIAKEKTKSVFFIQFFMNSINILLDVIFVLRFDMGVAGVAYASLIAEWTGLLIGIWVTKEAFGNRLWKNKNYIFDTVQLKRMAVVNSDILVRTLLLQAAILSFIFFGSSFDDETLAANQILIQFLHIASYGLDGFAVASESLVGKAVGAKKIDNFRQTVKMTSMWGAITVIIMAILFGLFGGVLISLMTTSNDVQHIALQYLPWMIIAPLIGAASWMLDGIFIGATRTADMRNMMLISFAIYIVSLFIFLPSFGNHGLWLALIVFYMARGITLGLRFKKIELTMISN